VGTSLWRRSKLEATVGDGSVVVRVDDKGLFWWMEAWKERVGGRKGSKLFVRFAMFLDSRMEARMAGF
jgi:hypothetical protein